MNNILNVKEAFEALQNNKTVLCRYAGNGTLPSDKDFSSLDQMPATVFVMPHYEFCIKIDEITINGYTFLKPYSLDELSEGQDVFLLGNTGSIVKGQFVSEYDELVLAVKNGSVQRDFENAQKQAKAIQGLLGVDNELVLKVADFKELMKLANKSKKSIRKKTESEPAQTESVKTTDTENTLSLENNNLGVGQQVEQYWEHQEILNDLIDRALKAQTPAEANALFKYTKGWTQEQSAPLHAAVSRRLQELPQPEVKEPPSLLVRIQKAADLTELDALEIDVSARDAQIVPALMAEVKKRRVQLEKSNDLLLEEFP